MRCKVQTVNLRAHQEQLAQTFVSKTGGRGGQWCCGLWYGPTTQSGMKAAYPGFDLNALGDLTGQQERQGDSPY